MGSFYTNVTLRHSSRDDVAGALRKLRRDAYVSPPHNGSVVVFDAAIESQDSHEIEKLVAGLSKRLRCAALAVVNHDDDMLFYALFDGGRLIDEYNSRPGYFDGRDDVPAGGDASVLCTAFGGVGREAELHRILHQGQYTFESERHAALVGALEMPPAAVGCGYEYITRGELPDRMSEGDLLVIGDAPNAARARAPQEPVSPAEAKAIESRLKALVRPSPELAVVIGPDPLPYGMVVMKVISYVMAHGLMDPVARVVRADAALRAVYGADRLTFDRLAIDLERHLTPA